jgi:hypothetical protein
LDSVQIAALVAGEELPFKAPPEESDELPVAASEKAEEPEKTGQPGVLPEPGNQPA